MTTPSIDAASTSSVTSTVASSTTAAAAASGSSSTDVSSEWDSPFFSFKKSVEVVFDNEDHGALHAREFIPKGFVFWHGTRT
jgi:hypothetical protein